MYLKTRVKKHYGYRFLFWQFKDRKDWGPVFLCDITSILFRTSKTPVAGWMLGIP